MAASLQDRIFNGHNNNTSSLEEEFDKNSATSQTSSQLSSHSACVNLQYEVKTEPGVHLKRTNSPNPVSKLPFKKQCTSSDYNEGNTEIFVINMKLVFLKLCHVISLFIYIHNFENRFILTYALA